jgi:hypothetical protein
MLNVTSQATVFIEMNQRDLDEHLLYCLSMEKIPIYRVFWFNERKFLGLFDSCFEKASVQKCGIKC